MRPPSHQPHLEPSDGPPIPQSPRFLLVAVGPADPHPLRPPPSFLRPPPSFLRRQESMRPPSHQPRLKPSDGPPIPQSPRLLPVAVGPTPPPPSFLRPPPSFLRRQESMRPPSHQPRPHPPTALRSLNRRTSSPLQWDPPTPIPCSPPRGGSCRRLRGETSSYRKRHNPSHLTTPQPVGLMPPTDYRTEVLPCTSRPSAAPASSKPIASAAVVAHSAKSPSNSMFRPPPSTPTSSCSNPTGPTSRHPPRRTRCSNSSHAFAPSPTSSPPTVRSHP